MTARPVVAIAGLRQNSKLQPQTAVILPAECDLGEHGEADAEVDAEVDGANDEVDGANDEADAEVDGANDEQNNSALEAEGEVQGESNEWDSQAAEPVDVLLQAAAQRALDDAAHTEAS